MFSGRFLKIVLSTTAGIRSFRLAFCISKDSDRYKWSRKHNYRMNIYANMLIKYIISTLGKSQITLVMYIDIDQISVSSQIFSQGSMIQNQKNLKKSQRKRKNLFKVSWEIANYHVLMFIKSSKK